MFFSFLLNDLLFFQNALSDVFVCIVVLNLLTHIVGRSVCSNLYFHLLLLTSSTIWAILIRLPGKVCGAISCVIHWLLLVVLAFKSSKGDHINCVPKEVAYKLIVSIQLQIYVFSRSFVMVVAVMMHLNT
jgi:hypothetical protein